MASAIHFITKSTLGMATLLPCAMDYQFYFAKIFEAIVYNSTHRHLPLGGHE